MSLSRRVVIATLSILGLGGIAAAVAVAVVRLPTPQPSDDVPSETLPHKPLAVVDKTPWETGVIEKLEESDHTFVIRNEGDAPLQLRAGKTSCSCTIADLPTDPIPPGGDAKVRVATKLSYEQEHDTLKAGRLRRAVEVYTNDPNNRRIVLEILTTVVHSLGAKPASIALSLNPTVAPSQDKRTTETIVYSQTWDKFDLKADKCSVEGAKYRIEPAKPADLTPLNAKSGYRVEVSLSPDMPEGYFRGTLDLSAKPADASLAARTLHVPIDGRVDGRVTLSGFKLDAKRTLHLGTLDQGQNASAFFIFKINDDHKIPCGQGD